MEDEFLSMERRGMRGDGNGNERRKIGIGCACGDRNAPLEDLHVKRSDVHRAWGVMVVDGDRVLSRAESVNEWAG